MPRSNSTPRFNSARLPNIMAAAVAAGQRAALLAAAAQGVPLRPMGGFSGRVMPGMVPGGMHIPGMPPGVMPIPGYPMMPMPGMLPGMLPMQGIPVPVPVPVAGMMRSHTNVSETSINGVSKKIVSSTVEHAQPGPGMPTIRQTQSMMTMNMDNSSGAENHSGDSAATQNAGGDNNTSSGDAAPLQNKNECPGIDSTRDDDTLKHQREFRDRSPLGNRNASQYKEMEDSPHASDRPAPKSQSHSPDSRFRDYDTKDSPGYRSRQRDDNYFNDNAYGDGPVKRDHPDRPSGRMPLQNSNDGSRGSSDFGQPTHDRSHDDQYHSEKRNSQPNDGSIRNDTSRVPPSDSWHSRDEQYNQRSNRPMGNHPETRDYGDNRGSQNYRESTGPTWRTDDNARKEYFGKSDNSLYDGEGDITSKGETGTWRGWSKDTTLRREEPRDQSDWKDEQYDMQPHRQTQSRSPVRKVPLSRSPPRQLPLSRSPPRQMPSSRFPDSRPPPRRMSPPSFNRDEYTRNDNRSFAGDTYDGPTRPRDDDGPYQALDHDVPPRGGPPRGGPPRGPVHDGPYQSSASDRPVHLPPQERPYRGPSDEDYSRPSVNEKRHQIYIDNIPLGTRAVDVRDLIQPHASVVLCYVKSNLDHDSLYSIVTLESERDVMDCVEALDQCLYRGSVLSITQNSARQSPSQRD